MHDHLRYDENERPRKKLHRAVIYIFSRMEGTACHDALILLVLLSVASQLAPAEMTTLSPVEMSAKFFFLNSSW